MDKTICVILILVSAVAAVYISLFFGNPLFQSSSESSEFVQQVKKNRKEGKTEFQNYDELVKIVELGDAIECKRKLWLYSHWSIYIGQKEVIEVQSNLQTGMVEVLKSKLEDVMHGDHCRVHNLEEAGKRRGLEKLPNHSVMSGAIKLLLKFKQETLPYSITDFNCEHFVTMCLFGKPFSEQAENVATKPSVDRASYFFLKAIQNISQLS